MAHRFIIVATARSGSNYLCSLLSNNGVGRPREDFNAWLLRSAFAQAIAHGKSTEKFAAEIELKAKKPFGTKILWSFVEPMLTNSGQHHLGLDSLLHDIYPKAKYVFLSRRNKVDQAISRVRAEVTNEWVRRNTESVRSPKKTAQRITADAIHSMVLTILREELEWRRFFAQSKIKPLKIIYEDLCEDPEVMVGKIGRFILGRTFKVKTLSTPLLVQRDLESEALRLLYLKAVGAQALAR
jgi:trehalose 2-sulfotransferase